MKWGELLRLRTVSRVVKFYDTDGSVYRMLRSGAALEEVILLYRDRLIGEKREEGNVFLNEGKNYIWRLVVGESGLTPFNSANAHIGVGDSDQPESPDQTGLLGTNKYYKSMDGGYPIVSGGSVRFRATFDYNEANFTWNEWTVANGPGDEYVNINRKVTSLGTKTSDAIWALEVTLTFT
ncbi:MAG: hypothetical protein QXF87_05640 [Thermofilaceae archaeon]